MSQLFEIRITARGPADAAKAFQKFIANEWREMSMGKGILNGFTYVPKAMPIAKSRDDGKDVHLTFDFQADGPQCFLYAIAISQKFPSLRFALMTADASDHEWLALTIVAFRGSFACAQFVRGKEGCPMGFNDRRLLSFLASQVSRLEGLISDDGKIVEFDSDRKPFSDLEVGVSQVGPAGAGA